MPLVIFTWVMEGLATTSPMATGKKQLRSFLDFVEDNHGRLVICGDLFELWQSNISKVLTKRIWLS